MEEEDTRAVIGVCPPGEEQTTENKGRAPTPPSINKYERVKSGVLVYIEEMIYRI